MATAFIRVLGQVLRDGDVPSLLQIDAMHHDALLQCRGCGRLTTAIEARLRIVHTGNCMCNGVLALVLKP